MLCKVKASLCGYLGTAKRAIPIPCFSTTLLDIHVAKFHKFGYHYTLDYMYDYITKVVITILHVYYYTVACL